MNLEDNAPVAVKDPTIVVFSKVTDSKFASKKAL